jgi:guanyl-specific ribonuclease Sa
MVNAKKWTALLLLLGLLASLLCGCVETAGTAGIPPQQEQLTLLGEEPAAPAQDEPAAPDEDGSYTSKEDVCAYLIAYGHLPSNFITKDEARAAGWEGGSLEKYCPGKCIGGDRFGNREGLLPKAKGRVWTECDINTLGARSRGAERIVFSNDGLIYYTGDHYESFQLLYGKP